MAQTFYYTVTDGNGHTDAASVTIKILSRPVVTLTAPEDYQRISVSSSPITIQATAQDYDSKCERGGTSTNGVAYKTLIKGAGTSFSRQIGPSSTAGYYTFTAVATDNDGLSQTSAPVTVVVTNTSRALMDLLPVSPI